MKRGRKAEEIAREERGGLDPVKFCIKDEKAMRHLEQEDFASAFRGRGSVKKREEVFTETGIIRKKKDFVI